MIINDTFPFVYVSKLIPMRTVVSCVFQGNLYGAVNQHYAGMCDPNHHAMFSWYMGTQVCIELEDVYNWSCTQSQIAIYV